MFSALPLKADIDWLGARWTQSATRSTGVQGKKVQRKKGYTFLQRRS
jgi:hypothetical protein